MIDVKEIKKLCCVFSDEDIEEIEIRHGKDSVKVVMEDFKRPKVQAGKTITTEMTSISLPQTQKAEEKKQSVFELCSPYIGFFTRINPKTGENYIKLRDVVKKGGIVGHVRVLGVLQDLKVQVDGKVKEILVEEGQPIEYGQPIMRFEIVE